jgi:hypothetical protein
MINRGKRHGLILHEVVPEIENLHTKIGRMEGEASPQKDGGDMSESNS